MLVISVSTKFTGTFTQGLGGEIYEIWDMAQREILVDKLNFEQLIKILPIYKGFFGSQVVAPCVISAKGKHTFLSETKLERLIYLAQFEREIGALKHRTNNIIREINDIAEELNNIIHG